MSYVSEAARSSSLTYTKVGSGMEFGKCCVIEKEASMNWRSRVHLSPLFLLASALVLMSAACGPIQATPTPKVTEKAAPLRETVTVERVATAMPLSTRTPVKPSPKPSDTATLAPTVTPTSAPTLAPATLVGGPIVSDITWTLANSPYLVVENIQVMPEVTLTIEPGVAVRFDRGKLLQVEGTLIARGTESSPITFTSAQASPQPGDWGGIIFIDSSVDATLDGAGNYLGGSVLQYCIVEYGGDVVESAVHAPAAAPFIDHCRVRNNASRGIRIAGSSGKLAVVSHSTVNNNSASKGYDQASRFGGGIYAEYSKVVSNTISDNTASGEAYGAGIYALNSMVSNNIITGNRASNDSTSGNARGGGILAIKSTINNNIVTGNRATSLNPSLGGGIAAYQSTVDSNIVTGNSSIADYGFRGGFGGGIDAAGTTVVSNNIVTGNLAQSGGGIFAAESTFSNNTITSNTVPLGGQGAGVYFNYDVNFIGNTVVGNSGPITETCGALGVSGSAGNYRTQVHLNNIYGNTPFDVVKEFSGDISGTLNYWGTVENLDILRQNYDGYDDSARGRFLYIPYLEDLAPEAPVPPPLNLRVTWGPDSATVAWDPLPSITTGYGYKVYYGQSADPPYDGTGADQGASPVDVGNKTSLTLSGLAGGPWYVTVTAYDTRGRESWYAKVVGSAQ